MYYIVIFVIHAFICFLVAKLAQSNGKSFVYFFFVSFFTSAIVGLIILLTNRGNSATTIDSSWQVSPTPKISHVDANKTQSIPREIHYKNKDLVISSWRLKFAFVYKGEVYPYTGIITDVDPNNHKIFEIYCTENGYIRLIHFYHKNGRLAGSISPGTYLQTFGDIEGANDYSVSFYDEDGNTITSETFEAKYSNISDWYEKCMNSIPKRDC